MAEIQNVAVIGAGTMGSGIAHVFARSGFPVTLCDVEQRFLDRALDSIRKNLGREAAKGKLAEADVESALDRITTTVDIESLAGIELAVEAAPERFELKAQVFHGPRSHPSAISDPRHKHFVHLDHKDGCAHQAPRASDRHALLQPRARHGARRSRPRHGDQRSTFATVYEAAVQLGKTPVEVNDAPGFVSNRVLMPLINEAAFAVMEGVATPEAVDQVFKLGMAHPMGPLTLADFIGIDVCVDILRVLQEGFGDPKYRPCPLLVRMVDAGWLGRKSGRGFYTYASGSAAIW